MEIEHQCVRFYNEGLLFNPFSMVREMRYLIFCSHSECSIEGLAHSPNIADWLVLMFGINFCSCHVKWDISHIHAFPFHLFPLFHCWQKISQILGFELMHLVESFTPMCVTLCSDADFTWSLLFTILLISRTCYTHCSWFFFTMMISPGPQPFSQPKSSINCSSFYFTSFIELFSTWQKENSESFSWKGIDAVVEAT